LPNDPECKFDLDALNADNTGNVRMIRIGFFGDCGVGKTALVHSLVGEPFRDFPPTIFETVKHSVSVGAGWKARSHFGMFLFF
jgi:GTPase SAR1 family protein